MVYRRTDRTSNTLKGQVLANVLANVLFAKNSQCFHQAGRSRAAHWRSSQKFGAAKHRISSMPWSVEKTHPKNTPEPARKHQHLHQQKRQHSRHHIVRHGVGHDQPFFVRTSQTLFFAPSLTRESRNARSPSKDGRASGHREAARSRAQRPFRDSNRSHVSTFCNMPGKTACQRHGDGRHILKYPTFDFLLFKRSSCAAP